MTNTNNILKPIILVSITAIISLSVGSVVTWYVMTNNKPDTIIEVKYVENSREESTDLDLGNQMLIEENSFKIKVPITWKVEKIECAYCTTLQISKQNYYIRINTDGTFTGGGMPGNPYRYIFENFSDQTSSINDKLIRTDFNYDGDTLQAYLKAEIQTLADLEPAKQVVADIQTDKKYWVGSTIGMPSNPEYDQGPLKFFIRPSQFKSGQPSMDDNGKLISMVYGYSVEPDASVNEDFRNHPVLINRPVATDSPEHKAILEEMDSIVKTFEVK